MRKLPIFYYIWYCNYNFLWKLNLSDNSCVKLCRTLMLNGSNSSVCKSSTFMSYTLNMSQYRVSMSPSRFFKLLQLKNTLSFDIQDYVNTGLINDLLHTRQFGLDGITSREINEMLNFVCTV